MRKEELMIGDWVRDKKTKESVQIKTHWNLYFADEYEPIEITPEILEKNEFDYDGFNNLYGNDYFNERPIFIEPKDDSFEIVVLNVLVQIKYVHELQHAFRLCKIENDILI